MFFVYIYYGFGILPLLSFKSALRIKFYTNNLGQFQICTFNVDVQSNYWKLQELYKNVIVFLDKCKNLHCFY